MMRRTSRWIALVCVTVSVSCGGPTEPLHSDVDLARTEWLKQDAQRYTFEVAIASSWFPKSGYYRVEVVDAAVLTAHDSAGQVAKDFNVTVELIWDSILSARARGELNSAIFNLRGVPVEADMGPWPVDGGVHYSVRNFVKKS